MNHYVVKNISILMACLFSLIGTSEGQTPAPMTGQQFQLLLADQSTGTAVFLPTSDGRAYLVYATNSGKLGIYCLTPEINPPIPPTPDPPTPPTPPKPVPPGPPTPPTPPKPSVSNFITVSESEAVSITAEEKRILSEAGISYWAYTVAMVADKNPPANSLKWIGRTAGKQYPYSFFASADGVVAWEGTSPIGGNAIKKILQGFSTNQSKKPECPAGICPLKKGQ